MDQSAIVLGKAALQYRTPISWKRINAASGESSEAAAAPSLTGKATERKAWYKASMLWSASAKTKNPEAAVAWINWFANDQAAADIDKAGRASRRTPILAAVTPKLSPAQQEVAKYITDIKPELASTPIAPPLAAAR